MFGSEWLRGEVAPRPLPTTFPAAGGHGRRVAPYPIAREAFRPDARLVRPPVRREAAPPPRLGRGEGSEADERAFAAAPTLSSRHVSTIRSLGSRGTRPDASRPHTPLASTSSDPEGCVRKASNTHPHKTIRVFLRPHEDLSSIYRVSEAIDPRFSSNPRKCYDC